MWVRAVKSYKAATRSDAYIALANGADVEFYQQGEWRVMRWHEPQGPQYLHPSVGWNNDSTACRFRIVETSTPRTFLGEWIEVATFEEADKATADGTRRFGWYEGSSYAHVSDWDTEVNDIVWVKRIMPTVKWRSMDDAPRESGSWVLGCYADGCYVMRRERARSGHWITVGAQCVGHTLGPHHVANGEAMSDTCPTCHLFGDDNSICSNGFHAPRNELIARVDELEAENAKLSRLVDDITELHERLECERRERGRSA